MREVSDADGRAQGGGGAEGDERGAAGYEGVEAVGAGGGEESVCGAGEEVEGRAEGMCFFFFLPVSCPFIASFSLSLTQP